MFNLNVHVVSYTSPIENYNLKLQPTYNFKATSFSRFLSFLNLLFLIYTTKS